jgi:hypothetical protein
LASKLFTLMSTPSMSAMYLDVKISREDSH